MNHRTGFCKMTSLLLMLCISIPLHAEEWAAITEADWSLGAPAEYPDAGAIVVFDNGNAAWHERSLRFARYRRVKVLTDVATDSVGILSFEMAEYDDLKKFRGRIARRDGTEIKMKKKALAKTTMGDVVIYTARFEDVLPGDIIEWSYEIDYYGGWDYLGPMKLLMHCFRRGGTVHGDVRRMEQSMDRLTDKELEQSIRNLPTWYFDSRYFTMSSVLQVDLFSQIQYGFYPSNMPEDAIEPQTTSEFLGARKKYRWSLTMIPPHQAPDQETSSRSDRVAIYFNMLTAGYRLDINHTTYSNEYWSELGTKLRGYLDAYCDKTRKCRKMGKKLSKSLTDDREKIDSIYHYVATEYRQPTLMVALRPRNWNVGNFYTKKLGAAFEANVLLWVMLKAAGVSARPVFINTEGRVSFRKTGHFNHMIVVADVDDQRIFLDACSDACTAGALPQFSLTDEGFIVDEDALLFCKIGAEVCETLRPSIESDVP